MPNDLNLNDAHSERLSVELEACYAFDYRGARHKFLAASERLDAHITTYVHPCHRGPGNEPLAIDVVRIGNPYAPRQLVCISGTHGQEGFAGSAAQIAWMQSPDGVQLPPDTSVLMIHALNPWGFAYLSRTTENNVDLNRNFIDHATVPQNLGYRELHPRLLGADWDRAEASADEALAEFGARHGPDQLFHVIASGQYEFAEGLNYGGTRREWSNHTLEEISREHLASAERVAFIDWHTGIGEYGHAFFLCFNAPDSDEFAQAARWWGTESVGNGKPHGMQRPEYRGLVFYGLNAFLGKRPMAGAVIEFGTRGTRMRRALRLDLWLKFHGDPATDKYRMLRDDMRDAFCPFDTTWRERTIQLGRTITQRAISGLATWQSN